MATSVGSAYVSLMPSMDGFASKIGKEFGSQGNAAGKAFGDSMTVGIDGGAKKSSGILTGLGTVAKGVATAAVAGFTALTGAVTAIGGAALSAYADYEQLVGGVDTLFGSASQTLQGYAAEAYKTCGMSANQYMTQATSFAASLVSSCSGDVAKAADYANMAMGDMSDNVNKMGSDMTDVQNAYQGFAKQNYTMLDNLKLGYGGTQAEMKRLIADANKLRQEQGKNADLTIDSYADVVEAIHTVQENMGITGTTAKEAATTISGSIGMAKAAWENFITGLGRDDVDFSQLTQQLLESIGAVATNVAPRVAQIGKGIVEAFPVVLSGLGPVLGPVLSEALATAWNIAVGALAELGIQLPTVDASQITGAFQAIADAAASVVGTCKSAFGKLGEQIPGIWDHRLDYWRSRDDDHLGGVAVRDVLRIADAARHRVICIWRSRRVQRRAACHRAAWLDAAERRPGHPARATQRLRDDRPDHFAGHRRRHAAFRCGKPARVAGGRCAHAGNHVYRHGARKPRQRRAADIG